MRRRADDLAHLVSEVLRDRISGQIEVVRVLLPLIRFDEDTQNKVNAFNSEVANTRIAEQQADRGEGSRSEPCAVGVGEQ